MIVFTGNYTSNGKPKYRMISYDESACGKQYNGMDIITVPCGRCLGCRIDYSRQWANRCMLEKESWPDELCWFVTLTYDDQHLPKGSKEFPTLVKKDLQLFVKRLRKATDREGIRYFACGEYGSQTARPHYHLILYNLPLDDLQPFGRNELGDQYFRSEFLESVWQHQGFVSVGRVSWESCAYTARYIVKKHYGKDSTYYSEFGIAPEFVVMSRRPGIGYAYFERNKERMYEHDRFFLGTETRSIPMTPPKYFDRKLAEEDPIRVEEIKAVRRAFADEQRKGKLLDTDLDYLSVLCIERDQMIQKYKALQRKKV